VITLAWRVLGIAFSLAVAAAAALLWQVEPQTWAPDLSGFSGTLYAVRTDDLTVLMLAIVGVVAGCVQVYSIGYLHGEPRTASYTAIVTLFTAAMVTVVVADSLFLLLIGWEVMGVCSYLLIGQYWERRDARAGAVKAFLMTRFGDVGFLFGIFVLGVAGGSFRISELEPSGSGLATVGTFLLLCGVVGKSAQIPLQTWLPDAMPGPAPVSALIHAATMVAAGVFLVARMFDVFVAAPGTLSVLAVIAALTMVVAALCATAAVEVKRVLAWSTVSQLAVMFGGLALGTDDGRHAGLFHLLTHAAFKALLFLCAGVLLHQVGSATFAVLRRRARHGVLRKLMPVTFGTMTIGLAALAGVPGLSGFFSKDSVVEAAWHAARDGGGDTTWPALLVLVAVLVTGMLTAFYCTRLWLWAFFGSPAPLGGLGAFEEEDLGDSSADDAQEQPHRPLRDGSPWMLAPMVLLALATLVLGYAEASQLDPAVAGVTTLALMFGAVPAYSLWKRGADPRPAVLEREFGFDAFYQLAVVRPVRFAAGLVVTGDRDVIDGWVRGFGKAGTLASAGFRRLQTGNVQTYLTAAVLGVVALAVLAGVIAS
jgi:NADH-quinone oxidoreductase subunit L